MEWVETTGSTVAEAVEQALDRLGVVEADAEVVVLEEAKTTMFGLRKVDARVRVRVRPVQARAKRPSRRASGGAEGRPRRSSSSSREASQSADTRSSRPRDSEVVSSADDGAEENRSARSRSRPGGSPRRPARNRAQPSPTPSRLDEAGSSDRDVVLAGEPDRIVGDTEGTSHAAGSESRPRRRRSRSVARTATAAGVGERRDGGNRVTIEEEQMSIEAQAELAEHFVRGVVERFGLEARLRQEIADDTVRIEVAGDNLGILIGPRGATVDALQELTRTAVQHRSDEHAVRIVVDVGGYRLRRATALQQFARRVAAEVIDSGEPQGLDPMSATDRKIVHDTVNEISGVRTTSEGEDPRRFVVIHREAAAQPEPTSDEAELFLNSAPSDDDA
ncbi:MAG: RNA-binding cell elongation regulator Jag/EloR [Acidimicrobiales bacterium]